MFVFEEDFKQGVRTLQSMVPSHRDKKTICLRNNLVTFSTRLGELWVIAISPNTVSCLEYHGDIYLQSEIHIENVYLKFINIIINTI